MRENYRNSIASVNKFPQFTIMNAIDGQAGQIIYASLIFYSLTTDNILNIIVLLILAGVSIAMLTGENGLLSNSSKASTQNAYKGAEERVKLAAMAVKTEIMSQKVSNGSYDARTPENTAKLAQIVAKDFSNDSKWAVDGNTAGQIKITYTDSSIDKGVIDNSDVSNPKPRQEGKVEYIINLAPQDADLELDVAEGSGTTPQNPETPTPPASNLTTEETTAIGTNNTNNPEDKIAEVAVADIQDNDLKDTTKIKTVLKGETTGSHEIPIPVGATYITGTENTGVVISYKGSEFVWVPVPIAISDTETAGTTNKAMAINAGTAESPNIEDYCIILTQVHKHQV